jgi:putative glutamine amidotransferase
MSQKIKIGLTFTGTQAKHDNYVNWLKGDDDIDIIQLSAEDDNLAAVKDMDAIVLSGGVDAHPKTYGSSKTDYPNAPDNFNEKRDDFETAVFRLSQQLQIPVLAVCRGMQLINCILGGDMVQDIGPTSNNIHRNDGDDKKHSVNILPGSLLHIITNIDTTQTNSAHHQAIHKIGAGLSINANSADGIIEGVEWTDKSNKPFMLAVQWHPERMYKLGMQASPLSKNIRDYFINEIIKSKKSK